MTNNDTFVQMSAALTGISADVLAPAVTNFDLATTYYESAEKKYPNDFPTLLSKYDSLITDGKTPEEAIQTIQDDSLLGPMARQINFLWYMGAWAVETAFGVQTRNLSVITYQKGMVWQVMQSHPMGYSVSRYGYWGAQPGTLEQYVGSESGNKKGGQKW